MSHWIARAPSNIALVKYMGKTNLETNLPANGSLSMTLDSLCSFVEIGSETGKGGSDGPEIRPEIRYEPELPSIGRADGLERFSGPELKVPVLNSAGVDRMIRFLRRVVAEAPQICGEFKIPCERPRALWVRTANTFPAASGIASSASSFAAMTLAALSACGGQAVRDRMESTGEDGKKFRRRIAALSRQGSGSSCRSFEGPFVMWEDEHAEEVALSPDVRERLDLTDLILLVASTAKEVSSSQAHRAVLGSPLWNGRVERVASRLHDLQAALKVADLHRVSRLAWDEMWEMHSLFHTAPEPFTYWEPESLAALKWVSHLMKLPAPSAGYGQGTTPPIVTMDAGPNVHLLVPTAEAPRMKAMLRERFPNLAVLEDRSSGGARVYGMA